MTANMTRKQQAFHAQRMEHKHQRAREIQAECDTLLSEIKSIVEGSAGRVGFSIPAEFLDMRKNATYLHALQSEKERMQVEWQILQEQDARAEAEKQVKISQTILRQFTVLLTAHPELKEIVTLSAQPARPTEATNMALSKQLQDAVALLDEAFDLGE